MSTVKQQTFQEQVFKYWLLAGLIRKGFRNEHNEYQKLSAKDMLKRLAYFFTHFEWTPKIEGKLHELETYAHSLEKDNADGQGNSRELRTAS